MSKHYDMRRIDNSINFPREINVHENRAPTDESIQMAKDMEKKVMDKMVANVSVDDNIVSGKAIVFGSSVYTTLEPSVQIYFKLKINGQEFTIERKIEERELSYDREKATFIQHVQSQVKDWTKAVIIYYTGKFLAVEIYNENMPQPLDEDVFKKLIK